MFFPLSFDVHVVLEDQLRCFAGVVIDDEVKLLAGVTEFHVKCNISDDTFLKFVGRFHLTSVVNVDFVFFVSCPLVMLFVHLFFFYFAVHLSVTVSVFDEDLSDPS